MLMTKPDPNAAQSKSLVQVRIGNREYNAFRDNRCATCIHPARMEIERMLVEAHPYQRIAATFSDFQYTVGRQKKTVPSISWNSIRNHYNNGHMPVDAKAVRDIAEQRLKEIGQHIEGLQERLVDSTMVARLVMAKGFERLARGETEVTVKETLAAAKLMTEIDMNSQQSETGDVSAWQEAMTVYFQEAQKLMPPAVWDEFVRRLMSSPQLKAIAARIDDSDPQPVDAEVVEPQKESL
jgi:hypothetical protein